MNNRETIIEALRGEAVRLGEIKELFDGCDIYDAGGYVDCDFLTRLLMGVNDMMAAAEHIMGGVNRLLGGGEESGVAAVGKGRDAKGREMQVEDVLGQCVLKDNILYLPDMQLDKKTYMKVKKRIEEAGGKWAGGKVQGFTFDFDATRVVSLLREGKGCNLAQEYQFFETPAGVADWLVSLAGGIRPDMSVLEPSAGRGAIVRAIHRVCPDVTVDCYELMPENRELLGRLPGIRLKGNDFAECTESYDLIVANPPFSGNQDIRHVRMMCECLRPGGTLAAITSRHWQIGSERQCADFRKWIEEVSGRVYTVEAGAFASSGTDIGTVAVVITKR